MSEARAAETGGGPAGPGPDPAPRPAQSRRARSAVAAAAGLVFLVAAIAVPLVDGDGGGETGPSGTAAVCSDPAQITPAALPAGDAWQRLVLPPVRSCATLTATDAGPAGVDPGSGFVLASPLDLDADDVQGRLRVDPPVRLDVQPERSGGGGSRLRVQPAEPLSENAVYRFTLLDRERGQAVEQWSFQAAGPVRVVQTLPATGRRACRSTPASNSPSATTASGASPNASASSRPSRAGSRRTSARWCSSPRRTCGPARSTP